MPELLFRIHAIIHARTYLRVEVIFYARQKIHIEKYIPELISELIPELIPEVMPELIPRAPAMLSFLGGDHSK